MSVHVALAFSTADVYGSYGRRPGRGALRGSLAVRRVEWVQAVGQDVRDLALVDAAVPGDGEAQRPRRCLDGGRAVAGRRGGREERQRLLVEGLGA
jgi:hypothetical protein